MNRDEILSSFQALSSISDFDECIQILESVDWDLQKALDCAESNPNNILSSRSFAVQTSVKAEAAAMSYGDLTFNVSYEKQNFIIKIRCVKTVGDLRQAISEKVKNANILVDMNLLDQLYDDNTSLANFNVEPYHSITATNIGTAESTGSQTTPASSDTSQDYTLTIRMYTNGVFKQHIVLNFPAKSTIAMVKSEVAQITSKGKKQHKWTGWPSNIVGSEVTLEDSGLDKNATLWLDIIDNTPHASNCVSQGTSTSLAVPEIATASRNNDAMDIDDDDYDDYENDAIDFDESHLVMPSSGMSSSKAKKPSLLEHDAHKNQFTATLEFVHEFNRRYFNDPPIATNGACKSAAAAEPDNRPRVPFFVGTLNDAIRETLNKQPTERRPLFIYIHHGMSIQSNIYCSQTLCDPNICSYFTENEYQIWPWDITYPDNKKSFLHWFTQLFGNSFAGRLRIISDDEYPVLLGIGKTQGVYDILGFYDNKKTQLETLTSLYELQVKFRESQLPDIAAWEEREHRALVKLEQDEAYKQSLLMDQAKEQKRDAEVKARKEAEIARLQEAERVENERQSRIDDALKLLPSEPDAGTPDSDIVIVRFRAPAGSSVVVKDPANLTRKFLLTHKLSHLLAFMESLGYFTSEYKLLMSYPRKNLAEVADKNASLKDIGLMKRENLIIELI